MLNAKLLIQSQAVFFFLYQAVSGSNERPNEQQLLELPHRVLFFKLDVALCSCLTFLKKKSAAEVAGALTERSCDAAGLMEPCDDVEKEKLKTECALCCTKNKPNYPVFRVFRGKKKNTTFG